MCTCNISTIQIQKANSVETQCQGTFDSTLEGPQGGGEEEQEQQLRQHRTSFRSLAAEFPLGTDTDISPPTQGHHEPLGAEGVSGTRAVHGAAATPA